MRQPGGTISGSAGGRRRELRGRRTKASARRAVSGLVVRGGRGSATTVADVVDDQNRSHPATRSSSGRRLPSSVPARRPVPVQRGGNSPVSPPGLPAFASVAAHSAGAAVPSQSRTPMASSRPQQQRVLALSESPQNRPATLPLRGPAASPSAQREDPLWHTCVGWLFSFTLAP